MATKYTNESIEWLIANANNYCSFKEFTEAFNKIFNLNKTESAINQYCSKVLHICVNSNKKALNFTDDEKLWLKNNYCNYQDYDVLTNDLNLTFKLSRKRDSVKELCTKRLGLKGMPNNGVYKKGNVKEQLPIGTIRRISNGSTYIKVKDSYLSKSKGYAEPYWIPLQKKIYEDVYGKVDKDKMVIFLDCNKDNFDIHNLYCIDRRISMVLASNKWYTEDAELTLTAIKWAELYYSIKK